MIQRSIVCSLSFFAWLWFAATPASVVAQATGVTITGTVVDGSLTPLTGAVITLNRQGAVVARTTSNAEGRFRFEKVVPGDYEVRATHAKAPALVRPVRIGSGAAIVNLPLVMASAVTKTESSADTSVSARAGSPALAVPPPNMPTIIPPAAQSVGAGRGGAAQEPHRASLPSRSYDPYPESRDRYDAVEPNRFNDTRQRTLSTFGADVDTASYVNVRRFIANGQLPPSEAVRVEDFLNYFKPDYALPRAGHPVALTTEVGDAPWAPGHKLVLVGARARLAAPASREGRNIVLLLDVSGSMAPADRLPLLKTALGLFVDTLQPDDRLAIVTYAGSSGVALPSTPARRRDVIQRAIANLHAGGSTNGAQGIVTAYRIARESYIPGGVNRVMLATDGDFNVGVTREGDLVRLIERERESGVFLSIFGVGTGNLNDSALEKIANKGNGHYVYLDSLQEARRVMLHETDAMLETVAKDVKFQVEFNPATVSAWKLIGYESRLMAARDFHDDRKDGGEMGAGHTVTVLYEIIPAVSTERRPLYQDRVNDGLATVRARFKEPEGEVSRLIEQMARPGARARHLPFAASVAEFGLMLRDGTESSDRWEALSRRLATAQVSPDLATDKANFIEMVETAKGLARLQRRR